MYELSGKWGQFEQRKNGVKKSPRDIEHSTYVAKEHQRFLDAWRADQERERMKDDSSVRRAQDALLQKRKLL